MPNHLRFLCLKAEFLQKCFTSQIKLQLNVECAIEIRYYLKLSKTKFFILRIEQII